MKNIQGSLRRKGGLAVLTALTFFLLVSCTQGATELKDYDISNLYGYTFRGNITASSGNTLKPSLILYNGERAEWNMNVNGMSDNQFYYYAVKNSASNYTLYWFDPANQEAARNKDTSKAGMKMKLGINTLDEIVLLLIEDNVTDIGAMSNNRVPMQKQASIPKKNTAPPVDLDSSIKDVAIEIPSAASEADWGGEASYSGTFDYLLGEGGNIKRGHGTCGKDVAGNEITPTIGIGKDASGSHTVSVKVHRNASQPSMTTEAFNIPDVKVLKAGTIYYLKCEPTSVEAFMENGKEVTLNDVTVRGKLENGKLTLRVSFKPGKMTFPIIEIFKSK